MTLRDKQLQMLASLIAEREQARLGLEVLDNYDSKIHVSVSSVHNSNASTGVRVELPSMEGLGIEARLKQIMADTDLLIDKATVAFVTAMQGS